MKLPTVKPEQEEKKLFQKLNKLIKSALLTADRPTSTNSNSSNGMEIIADNICKHIHAMLASDQCSVAKSPDVTFTSSTLYTSVIVVSFIFEL
ncbi:hypothetical protein T4E_1781 [Trichinella pseudospiralis]|uniref:Uncharacterized protein n=1 Tax=Trichinella pseudospiralis TaxID=6337 RepID=A0A0V0Y345_TRIPS|nr:hypothetical protein T4E_1781 [Trichinella pseudospiralis]